MDIVLRSLVAFALLFLLLRVLGRRELSSMEPFDVILLVVIGDLVQQGVTQSDMSLTGSMLAIGTFSILTVLASWLAYRFRRLSPVLDAEPLIILQDGKLIEHNLKHERLTENEVAAAARQQQIASLDDVAWAVLEGNGRISFIPRS